MPIKVQHMGLQAPVQCGMLAGWCVAKPSHCCRLSASSTQHAQLRTEADKESHRRGHDPVMLCQTSTAVCCPDTPPEHEGHS